MQDSFKYPSKDKHDILFYKVEFDKEIGILKVRSYIDTQRICECKICIDKLKTKWSITAWYTDARYQHHGYGNQTMQRALDEMYQMFGIPEKIEYIWNGTHQYVMSFLEKHFNPICKLPLAVQKNSEVDDWDAHIYTLDRNKVLNYYLGI